MGNETPMFSLILPIFNMASYLEKCLNSCLQQQYELYEIICVDDGSTDESGNILDSFSEQYKGRIKVIHTANNGVSEARNCGIRAAKGLYCWFIDPDDTIEKDILGDIAKNIYNNDIMLLPYSEAYEENTKIETNEYWESPNDAQIQSFYEYIKSQKFDKVWNYIVRRSILTDNQLYFGNGIVLGEDRAFDFFLQQFIGKWVVYNKIAYHYIIRRKSASKGHIRNDCYAKRMINNTFWTAIYYDSYKDKCVNEMFLNQGNTIMCSNITMTLNEAVKLGDINLLKEKIQKLKAAGLYPCFINQTQQSHQTIKNRFCMQFNYPTIAIFVCTLYKLKKRFS